jgi:hypothetical protein
MPAQSQQQQKLFGLALSVKRGETPRSEASDEVLNIVNSMSEKEIEDFASTSHSGLPTKVETQLRGVVREIMKERVLSEAASRTAMEIGALTGMNKDAVQKFVDTHNLDIEKLFKYVKAGKLKERMDFVAAVVGNPDNKIQKMIISKFGIKEVVSEVSDGKKRFMFDFYTDSFQRNTERETNYIASNLGSAIKAAQHICKVTGYGYVEIYYKDLFLGSMKAKNKFEFVPGKGYTKYKSTNESVNEGLWPKSKLPQSFQFALAPELKKNFKGIFYSVGNDIYHNDKKVLTVDGDKDSVNSIINKLKSKIKESVNEGVSSAEMDKIKGAVEAAKSFMSVGAELKKLGMKYTFATEPLPIYIIQPTPNNRVAIVNKKYASKPDFVVGDIAVGIMEGKSVNEVKYPTDLKIGSVILGQGFTMLKGIEGGKYYKVVDMDDISATLVPSDKNGNVKGSKKVRHKLSSIDGGIKTAKRGDENGIVVIKETVTESSYNFGKIEYTKKKMTPVDIMNLAFAYAQTPTTKIIGNKHEYRVNAANDLAKLTGSVQLDAKTKGKEPALILFLLKNSLVTKDEYIKLFKALKEKQISVIKALKNSSPEMRGSGGAARAAAKDMRGEFDID